MNNDDIPATPDTRQFLLGGEVGTLMLRQDWSASPLGHPDTWPHSLKVVASLALSSRFPMFLAWGPDLGVVYNDAYAEILGAKHPAAIGQRFQDVWSEIWNDILPLVERALSGESVYLENLPLTMRRRGYDESTWFTFSYSPVRDETGAVAGMYCACTETTAQVLAEQQRVAENERLRTLFEQAPSLMAVMRGPQHVFELTNASYMQLIGHRDVLGKTAREALPEVAGQGFFELLDQVYASGQPYRGVGQTLEIQRQPGGMPETRFLDFIYQPIRDHAGAVSGIFVEGSDVTERVLAVEGLQQSDRRKDEFLAMLAHELRNPLAPISTAAQILKTVSLDAQRLRQTADIIDRQVTHMTDLVNDLLDVSRVTRGLVTLQKEVVDIKPLVASAVEQVRSLIEARKHVLTVRMEAAQAWVEADRTRLVQVIVNLLNNAAKYTPSGGVITLTVTAGARQVQIAVQDNGIGIEPALLPHIFDLFAQGERTPDRSQGGLGLGLALVKRLVSLHGGEVVGASAGPGNGSTFTVSLPLLEQAQQQGELLLSSAVGADARALSILLVDDNADAAQTLAALLESHGYRPTIAYDANSALEQASKLRPDVCILDIGLPDLDGYELARRLRADPLIAGATLFALSGYGQEHDRMRSLAAGFDRHLVKPVNSEQLIALLAGVR